MMNGDLEMESAISQHQNVEREHPEAIGLSLLLATAMLVRIIIFL